MSRETPGSHRSYYATPWTRLVLGLGFNDSAQNGKLVILYKVVFYLAVERKALSFALRVLDLARVGIL